MAWKVVETHHIGARKVRTSARRASVEEALQ